MSKTAPLSEPDLPRSSALDFGAVHQECVRAYQPANPEEMLLVMQIARAWFRLQRYFDMEMALMEKQRLSEMFETDLDRFNAFNRAITAAERMWRNAVRELQAARRRAALNSQHGVPRNAGPRCESPACADMEDIASSIALPSPDPPAPQPAKPVRWNAPSPAPDPHADMLDAAPNRRAADAIDIGRAARRPGR
jgi:hypothetical protein